MQRILTTIWRAIAWAVVAAMLATPAQPAPLPEEVRPERDGPRTGHCSANRGGGTFTPRGGNAYRRPRRDEGYSRRTP